MFLRVFLIVCCLLASMTPLQGAEPDNSLLQPGIALYEKGQYQQAYDYFFDLILQHPQDKNINNRLGQAAYGMGDYEAAVMAFERVLIIDPSAAEAKLELAKAFIRLGSNEIAAEYIDELLQAGLPQEICGEARQLLDELGPPESR